MPPETFDDFWKDLESSVTAEPEVKPLKGFNKSFVEGMDFTGLKVASKQGGKSNLVPRTIFMVFWNALGQSDGPLTREQLEEDHNLTRVLFVMSVASRLDYIEYDAEGDSIRLVK